MAGEERHSWNGRRRRRVYPERHDHGEEDQRNDTASTRKLLICLFIIFAPITIPITMIVLFVVLILNLWCACSNCAQNGGDGSRPEEMQGENQQPVFAAANESWPDIGHDISGEQDTDVSCEKVIDKMTPVELCSAYYNKNRKGDGLSSHPDDVIIVDAPECHNMRHDDDNDGDVEALPHSM